MLEDSTLTNAIGIGYRTTIYFSSKQDKKIVSTFSSRLKELKKMSAPIISKAEKIDFDTKQEFIDQMSSHITEIIYKAYGANYEQKAKFHVDFILNSVSNATFDSANMDTFLNSFINIVTSSLTDAESGMAADSLVAEFKDYLTVREGLSLDLGYAALLNFPNNTFDNTFFPKRTLWITPGFRFKNEKWRFLKILGVFRYTNYDLDYYKTYFPNEEVFQTSSDIGLAASGDFDKVSFNFEIVSRNSKTEIPEVINPSGSATYLVSEMNDFQSVGSISYQLNKDIVLTYSLGERFDEILTNNNIISLLTVNFGFGGIPKNALK
ncbi:MAG: hypothetical protein BalsKO_31390 [Balneolaceae bacterium]